VHAAKELSACLKRFDSECPARTSALRALHALIASAGTACASACGDASPLIEMLTSPNLSDAKRAARMITLLLEASPDLAGKVSDPASVEAVLQLLASSSASVRAEAVNVLWALRHEVAVLHSLATQQSLSTLAQILTECSSLPSNGAAARDSSDPAPDAAAAAGLFQPAVELSTVVHGPTIVGKILCLLVHMVQSAGRAADVAGCADMVLPLSRLLPVASGATSRVSHMSRPGLRDSGAAAALLSAAHPAARDRSGVPAPIVDVPEAVVQQLRTDVGAESSSWVSQQVCRPRRPPCCACFRLCPASPCCSQVSILFLMRTAPDLTELNAWQRAHFMNGRGSWAQHKHARHMLAERSTDDAHVHDGRGSRAAAQPHCRPWLGPNGGARGARCRRLVGQLV
jgi:hypothetical protein